MKFLLQINYIEMEHHEQYQKLKHIKESTASSLDIYEEIQEDELVSVEQTKQYESQIKQIKFQSNNPNNDLIDLLDIHEGTTVISSVVQGSYMQFLLERVIEIEGPLIIYDGYITSYKLYKIKSRKKDALNYDTTVSRRFNDFEYLHFSLVEQYGGCVIPKLPDKSIWASLNLQSQQFKQIRIKQMQRYLQNLLKHSKLRHSKQLKQFLFEDDDKFSQSKGSYYQKQKAIDTLKSLTSSALDLGKFLVEKISNKQQIPSYSRESQLANSKEDTRILSYEREIDELLRISSQVRTIIENTHKEIILFNEITHLVNNFPHHNNLTHIILPPGFLEFLEEYDTMCSFIQSCSEAIQRTKQLKFQIENLKVEQAQIIQKSKNNPRNKELDLVRNKLIKANQKCEKWTFSLMEELAVHTNEGRSSIEQFVKKFSKIKGQIYTQQV